MLSWGEIGVTISIFEPNRRLVGDSLPKFIDHIKGCLLPR